MDASKLHILPNSVPDPLKNEPLSRPGNYALFIGMVDRHKGIESLIEAWRIFDFPSLLLEMEICDKVCSPYPLQMSDSSGSSHGKRFRLTEKLRFPYHSIHLL